MLDNFKHTHFTREFREDCPECQELPAVVQKVRCSHCLGSRKVRRSSASIVPESNLEDDFYTCPHCKGTGVLDAYRCIHCRHWQATKEDQECDECFAANVFAAEDEREYWAACKRDNLKAAKEERRLAVLAELRSISADTL